MVNFRPAIIRFAVHMLSIAAICAGIASGQSDPDPNSPVPVLLRQGDTKRVLAFPVSRSGLTSVVDSVAPGSDVTVFVTGLVLMKGEGANALRVNVLDASGRHYRFPVLEIEPVAIKGYENVHAVTLRTTDSLGAWREPITAGDVLISVTWRGLATERLRLGYGSVGGKLIDPDAPKYTATVIDRPTSEYVTYRWAGDRMRFLEQAGFGPDRALDERVRRIGIRTYLAEQFEAPYPSAAFPYPNIPLRSNNVEDPILGCGPRPDPSTLEYRICVRDHYSMYPVQSWFFKEALYGDAQLRHKIAWALAQIWVISGVDTQQSSWMIAYHKKLSENAFGNYRTLMKDMTLNPGMGNYLDMARSTRNNPNENYPREILQLFSVGLFMLNPDGTLMLDGDGDPVPTYDQTTVDNFTKVFTGWSFCNVGCLNSQPSIVNYKDPMILNQNNHDITAKTLLSYPNAVNQNIPAGMNGNAELDLALDNIFNHPNVPPFVSKLLIQHLVTSDPSPAYVGRVSAVFSNNGFGVRGDMKSVIRAILLDPEARGDIKTDPNFGKLREPVQFVANVLRALNVKSSNLAAQSDGVIMAYTNGIGQNVFNSPTVFNYYPPDYVIPGTSLLGPEFGILTTGTAIGRANVMNTVTFGQIAVGENSPAGTRVDLTDLQALATADPSGNLVLDALNHRLLHNTMSPAMRSTILPAFTAVTSTNPLARAQAAVYLVATSSQFQVQR